MELCLLPTTSSLSSMRLKSCPSSESASWTQSLSKWNTSVALQNLRIFLSLWANSALHFLSSFWEAAATKTPGSFQSSWLVDQTLWNQRQFAGKHVSSPEPLENSELVNPGFQVALNSNLQETRSEVSKSLSNVSIRRNSATASIEKTRVLRQRFAFSKGLSFRSFALAPWSRWYDTRGYCAHPSCRCKQRLQTRDRCQTFKSGNGTQRA